MADRDFSRFIPPHLRQPLREAGAVGYNILDNLFGIDNDVDTTGELLGESLRRDPFGTAKAMGSAVVEGFQEAYADPEGTVDDLIAGFQEAYARASQPLPEDATPEEIGQRTSDLFALSAAIPGVGIPGRVVKGSLDTVADAAQVMQLNRFIDKNDPGAFGLSPAAGSNIFVPNEMDLSLMTQNPTRLDSEILNSLSEARRLYDEGMPAGTVFERTNVINLPIKDVDGNILGVRQGFAATDEQMLSLKPARTTNIVDVPSDDMGGSSGQYDFLNNQRIGLADDLSPEQRNFVLRHEMTHDDLQTSFVDRAEAGSSLGVEALNIASQNRTGQLDPLLTYFANPGEKLARLSQGDYPVDTVAMTALQALNPYLNSGKPLPRRGLDALEIVKGSINRRFNPDAPFPDLYLGVPMDSRNAVVTDPNYKFVERGPK